MCADMAKCSSACGRTWVKSLAKKPQALANLGLLFGAGEMNRTPDLLITNDEVNELGCIGLHISKTKNQWLTVDLLVKNTEVRWLE